MSIVQILKRLSYYLRPSNIIIINLSFFQFYFYRTLFLRCRLARCVIANFYPQGNINNIF